MNNHRSKFNPLVLLLMLSMMLISVALSAADGRGDTFSNIMVALGPLLVLIATPLISRLFKKLGIDLAESALEPILMRIIELIAAVEKSKKDLDGFERKNKVVDMVKSSFSKPEKKLLIEKYGSLETAVQAAFERSSTALK